VPFRIATEKYADIRRGRRPPTSDIDRQRPDPRATSAQTPHHPKDFASHATAKQPTATNAKMRERPFIRPFLDCHTKMSAQIRIAKPNNRETIAF